MALQGDTLFWSLFLIPQNTNFIFLKEEKSPLINVAEIESHIQEFTLIGVVISALDLKFIRLLVEGKPHLGKIRSTGLVHQNYSHANVFQNAVKIHSNTIRFHFISSPVRNMSQSLTLIFIYKPKCQFKYFYG